MGHLFLLVEGHLEGIDHFKKIYNRMPLKNGGTLIVREVKLFNLSYPNESEQDILAEMDYSRTNRKTPNMFSMRFKYPESPFKHGRINAMLNIFANVLRPFGIKPIDWSKVPKTKKQRETQVINIYPIGTVEDNEIENKVFGTKETWQ